MEKPLIFGVQPKPLTERNCSLCEIPVLAVAHLEPIVGYRKAIDICGRHKRFFRYPADMGYKITDQLDTATIEYRRKEEKSKRGE